MNRTWAVVLAGVAVLVGGCKKEEGGGAPPLSTLRPKPLPELDHEGAPAAAHDGGDWVDRTFDVAPAPVFGDEVPKDAARLELHGETATLDGAPVDASKLKALAQAHKPVLLVTDEDTFLAQAAPLFAQLDDADVETWLLHPEGKVAFPITLSDEHDFQQWLDKDDVTSRTRVIYRADGFELQTQIGKVKGYDPNGPSVPVRGGKPDLLRLRKSLASLKARFQKDGESCIVPSFGMELANVARAMTSFYSAEGERTFDALCVVYPRPGASSASAADGGGSAPAPAR